MKWLGRLVAWFMLMCATYVGNYAYFSQLEFNSQPNLLAIISFNFVYALVVYVSVRRASYVGAIGNPPSG